MKHKIIIAASLLTLIIMFQNFSLIKHRTPQSIPDPTTEVTAEAIKENMIDSLLFDLKNRYKNQVSVKTCFDKRISCLGIRNHDKCLNDKISQFVHCSNLDDKITITDLQ